MIKRFFFIFLTLSFIIMSMNVRASVDVISDSYQNTHNTHTPKLEPASLNPQGAFQIASVCFLGDNSCSGGDFAKGDEAYEIDTTKQCKNEGFVNTCSTGYCMDHSCPYNENYGKCLKENCPNNSSTTCTGAIDGKNACGVDCKKCCVTTCPSGYTYSSIPNGYVQDGEVCNHCTEGKKYKIKPNPCTGYSTCQYGPASGAASCLSGTTTKYNICRPCTETCPAGTTLSNPGGCGGSTKNECGTKTCYYAYRSCCSDSCSSGSTWVSCSDNYVTGSTECGSTCYACCGCGGGSYSPSGMECYNTYDDGCGRTCYSARACKWTPFRSGGTSSPGWCDLYNGYYHPICYNEITCRKEGSGETKYMGLAYFRPGDNNELYSTGNYWNGWCRGSRFPTSAECNAHIGEFDCGNSHCSTSAAQNYSWPHNKC